MLQYFPMLLVRYIALITVVFSMAATSSVYADIDCNSWSASNGSTTSGLDESDEIWWNSSVNFTLSSATRKTSGSTSISYPSGKTCNTSSGQCTVDVKQGSTLYTCTSPKLKIDSTPPNCDSWRTKEFSGDPWTTWDIVTNPLPWIPIRGTGFGPREDVRFFQVHISDSESGVKDGQVWVAQKYDASFLDENIPGAQNNLGNSARVTVYDNAGNSRDCVGSGKRIDGFAPTMALLQCTGFVSGSRLYSPGFNSTCSLEDRAGPSTQTVRFRIQTYAGIESGPSMIPMGGPLTDTWFDNGTVNRIFDAFGTRITSGAAYDTSIAALSRNIVPALDVITRVTARVCEFYGTSSERCTDTNSFDIVNFSPPPPIPVTAGNGWYECGGLGSLTWTSPPESPGVNSTSSSVCTNDGTGNDEPKSQAKFVGSVAAVGSVGCYCWDKQAPTLSPIVASTASWTNAPVFFTSTATNDNGGSLYSGITYSCDNGATWAPGTNSTSVSFACTTNSSVTQYAQVKACDMAGNCSSVTGSIPFLKETTKPTVVNYIINGTVHNHSGSVLVGDVTSTGYTYNPVVSLQFNASDLGGSGLKSLLFSCNPTNPSSSTDSRWIPWSTGTTQSFNLTTADGCNASEGVKTVYIWAIDIAGNISNRNQSSINYDKTPPTFDIYDGKTILLQATDAYSYSLENPSGGDSGIRDYSITWKELGIDTGGIDITSASLPLVYDFGDKAKIIPDTVSKRSAQIIISLEDRAGNLTTKTQNVDIIAEGNIANPSTRIITPSRGTATDMTADGSDDYNYRMIIRDKYGNIIRPVTNIREIITDWLVTNTATFIEGSIGAVLYKWDNNSVVSDLVGNTYSEVFSTTTSDTKADGTYNLKIQSVVPTLQGYTDYTNNEINVSRLAFNNALPASMGDAVGCPTNYVCVGLNTNASSYDRTLGDIMSLPLSPGGVIGQKLAFRPIVDVTLSKDFATLTDNSWHDITVVFKNNSISKNFSINQYQLDLRYTNDLYGFAGAEIKGDFGSMTSSAIESSKRISFVLAPELINSGSSVVKHFQIKTNTYGYGFGKFGFTSFIPYLGSTGNIINSLFPTGYNTRNLGIVAMPSFATLTTPILLASYGDGVSTGQKITIQGLMANTNKGNIGGTLEDAISVDTSALNKLTFKTTIKKNVEIMTRGLASDNGSTCEVLISSLPKDIHYYDFSNLSSTSINGNNGCKLTIRGPSTAFGTKNYNTLKISGKKTIIVRGGNVFIDSDLYYNDPQSMLAIIVLRSAADKNKGGNILLHPNVTNAVGGIYAEGSIMSYNGTKIYDADTTNEGELTKQLLWYGSIFSSNSVGGGFKAPYECPFDSDTYLSTKQKTCSQVEASRYDLAFLRRFVTINGGSGVCTNPSKQAAKSVGVTTDNYAFAGKRECYQSDPVNNGLRGTDKTNPIVIEYNPAIQTSGMKIFSAQ